MNIRVEQFSTDNSNPMLNVANDGTVLYSNEAGDYLLSEWGAEIGGKLPSSIIIWYKGYFPGKALKK
jgi:hypothetical protein